MRGTTARLAAAAVAFAFAAGCADEPSAPRDAQFLLAGDDPDAVRAVIDLSEANDLRDIIDAELVTPEAAQGIGTGSMIVITIPGEGRFGCSANFLWRTPARLYLGSAGHCFLPEDRTSTHGPGADYDASGVLVDVCVEGCETGFRSGAVDLLGTWVRIGKVAYARQQSAAGVALGFDFGVVEIPRRIDEVIRAEMPVWGGPTGTDILTLGKQACHYGHGIVTGETYPTKARTGIGGGSTAVRWSGTFVGAFGDSGSGLVACDTGLDGSIRGAGAIGVLTHLGASTADPGVIFGTTIAQSIELAREAKLRISLVLP
jgi:hypothetical protein